MTKTIFVLARTTGNRLVESYFDYNRMIELSGYKTCELSEIDYQSENVYIWSSPIGHPTQVFMHDEAKNRKCKLVLWNLEWYNWRDGKITGYEGLDYLGLEAHVDEMWVSDRHLLAMLHRFKPQSAHKVKFLVLGGHPAFGAKDYESRDFQWDFVHISYLTGMRGWKFEAIKQTTGLTIAPNAWGEQRDYTLKHSRWGLNLHQNPIPCLTPQRFMIFASYCLPIITDYCADPSPYICFQDALIHFDPRKTSVSNRELRNEAIEANYKMVTETHSFRKEVDRMVEGLTGLSIDENGMVDMAATLRNLT